MPSNSPAGRFCRVLELGSALVWEYLSIDDVRTLLQTFSNAFSQDFLDVVSLKAIDTFAVENETHLGQRCPCDWMRGLDFLHSNRVCNLDLPFGVDKTLPIFQEANGAQNLFRALLLTKTLLEPLRRNVRQTLLVPVVCPLSKLDENPTAEDLTRAMNSVYRNAGSRFFYKFKQRRGRSYVDYLDYHWDEIDGSSCRNCDGFFLRLQRE